MTTGETIEPSFILPGGSEDITQSLCYSPCTEWFYYSTSHNTLGIFDIKSTDTVKCLTLDAFVRAVALSSDGCMLAVNVDYKFIDMSTTIPAQLRIFSLTKDPLPPSFYVMPDFAKQSINNLRFFPDGSKIIATQTNPRQGPWAKIFTLPNELLEEDEGTTNNASDDITSNRNNKTLVCEEIDVFNQGFPNPDDRDERVENAETDEEYFELYNQMYYSSNLDGGFFCLAISPDTTRLVGGSNDGEVYIIESSSQKVLQCVRTYEYYKTVTGCHYNPVFAHQEFVTCDESGYLDIWHVQELDGGTEEVKILHRVKFEPGTCCCTYSPDGKLVALTSAAVFKTYIICSFSGDTLFTLVYKEESINGTYFCNSSLFFGYLCQVATIHVDNSLCFWKLPLVYSLKTLCLLLIKASVKYSNIDNLSMPSPVKLQLKYLYV